MQIWFRPFTGPLFRVRNFQNMLRTLIANITSRHKPPVRQFLIFNLSRRPFYESGSRLYVGKIFIFNYFLLLFTYYFLLIIVDLVGFEPTTFRMPYGRSSQLSYRPCDLIFNF